MTKKKGKKFSDQKSSESDSERKTESKAESKAENKTENKTENKAPRKTDTREKGKSKTEPEDITQLTPGSGAAKGLSFAIFSFDFFGMLGVLVIEIAVFGLLSNTFCSSSTFYSIANQVPDTVIVAVGMTFVLIIAGIDLSVGSVLAFSQAVLGYCLVTLGFSLLPAVFVCFCTGLLCGVVNGLVVVRWALPSFIVTLGMLEIARGGTYLVTDSGTIYIGNVVEAVSTQVPWLGEITWPVLICLGMVFLGQFVLSRTTFGRYMIAIGANEDAVRLSGINPKPIKILVFSLCGFLCGIAGLIQASRMSCADPNAGEKFELSVIAAVVIGGTSLMGGRGSVVKSFLGVLIVAVLDSGLVDLGAPEYAKRLIIGAVIVMAVILDYYRSRLAKGSQAQGATGKRFRRTAA